MPTLGWRRSGCWELWHFGTTTQTTGATDSDADGLINAGEHVAGTEPTDSVSVFSAFAVPGTGPRRITGGLYVGVTCKQNRLRDGWWALLGSNQ